MLLDLKNKANIANFMSTYKYSFFNDYAEGTHPSILDIMGKTNLIQENGYGLDTISQTAIKLIQQAIQNPSASIHFVTGGTQANLIVLSAMLKPYQSIIACNSAHINIHEAGAIEATGHKINTIENKEGKLNAKQIQTIMDQHTDEHTVQPKVVFISNSTELGTIYTKSELENISQFCHKSNLYLYLDGARLGSALSSKESDLTLPELSKLVDAFYIGGTKNGALLGEAIVINNQELQQDFRYHLKQRGALLAKGRIISTQFVGLFANNLYFELAKHANQMAEKLSCGIQAQGFHFFTHSTTNQIFPIFPDTIIRELQKYYGFYIWANAGNNQSVIRLVTSWATTSKNIEDFIDDLKIAIRIIQP